MLLQKAFNPTVNKGACLLRKKTFLDVSLDCLVILLQSSKMSNKVKRVEICAYVCRLRYPSKLNAENIVIVVEVCDFVFLNMLRLVMSFLW